MPNSRQNTDHVGLLEIEEIPGANQPEPAQAVAEPIQQKRRKLLGRRKTSVFAAAAAIVAVALGYFIHNALLYEDTDDAQVEGHVMPLSSRINGQVLQVNFVQGQLVHAGDVLVVIDPKDYKVAVDQAAADLADAQATATSSNLNIPITSASAFSGLDSAQVAIKNAEAGVLSAQQNVQADQATLLQAQANAVKTDADLSRYEQLVQEGVISRQQYDGALAAARSNQAAVKASQAVAAGAQQTLEQAQGKLLQSRADLRNAQTAPQQVSLSNAKAKSAESQVMERKAKLEQAQLNLGYTIIRSPVDGIIGKKSAEIGQNVGIGQELVDVVPLDDVWVTANFKETQLAHMKPGQAVEIKVDAYGRKWQGQLSNLGGGTGSVFSLLPPENATGNYVKVVQRVPVRIDFNRANGQNFNVDGLLKPGLSVEPEVRVR
ncbi:MAG TPA: HlyD family secretion protein [Terriglobales bacterium]|nr:HlyD family secretion protein [Terriglobales bacterium]